MTVEDLSKKLDLSEIKISEDPKYNGPRFSRAGHVAGVMALVLHHNEMIKDFEEKCYSLLRNDSPEQVEMLNYIRSLKIEKT